VPLFEVLITLVCSRLTSLSNLLHDTQNIVVVHGIAGLVGVLITGFLHAGGWRRSMVSAVASLPEGVGAGPGGSYCECYFAQEVNALLISLFVTTSYTSPTR
jgi:ammonia channel protein AmtB